MGRILSRLDVRGYSDKLIGLGETGACKGFGKPNAVQWWTASWTWAAAHTSRVAAISYFNSTRGNLKQNWRLTESSAKLAAFKSALSSKTACHL
jgi:hypothetical protein